MHSDEIRKRFLSYFEERGHAVIPSASLVPEGDSSTLFTTAGMQPLVPYLLGQAHPKGRRLTDIQKCVRTGDIDEVGDSSHLTFFEMLGNWSLGDYFKKEAIPWTFEYLTSREFGLGLERERLYVTVFEGNEDAPKDEESKEIWLSLGIPESRIYFMPASSNWWGLGDNGPCGPDTEIFYDVTGRLGEMTKEEYIEAEAVGKAVEVGNDVFIEYRKEAGKIVEKLAKPNVDFGGGFERQVMVVQGKDNVFETDLFETLMPIAEELSGTLRSQRIIADHFRSAVFMVTDGAMPSNTDRGYVVRRLIRRAVMNTDAKETDAKTVAKLVEAVVSKYSGTYPELDVSTNVLTSVLTSEVEQFSRTVEKGLREFEKLSGDIDGTSAFNLYQTYGFPVEMTREIATQKGISVDEEGFREEFKKHQETSRTASAGKFKGGLADHSDETVKLHTTHHLLLAALQRVLGDGVKQRGSNITPDRLRIDFSFDRKLTDEEKQKVEDQVNEWIQQDLSVVRREMSREEAEKIGAEMEFGQKYPDTVSVYFIENTGGSVISKEFCGGPHVEGVGNLGRFKIKKEEASSSGVRRIKAVLQ